MEGTQMNYDETNSVYVAIKELYLNYCEELENDKKRLEILCIQIKETKDYIQYLNSHQNSDTYVFSPRGVISKNNMTIQEGIYDTGKIIDFSDGQKKRSELLTLEEEKVSLEKNIARLESNIILLERNKNILKEVSATQGEKKIFEQKQEELIEEWNHKQNDFYQSIKNGPLDRLSYLLHMTEMIHTFIDNDPVRAKLELTNMKNDLQSVIKELEKTVNVPEGEN